MNEYVYVLSNESMPNLYKIGRTSLSIETRIQQLSSHSGVPTPFKLEFSLAVPNSVKSEQRLHEELAPYRLASNREFFKTDLDTIKDAFYTLSYQSWNLYHETKETIEQPLNALLRVQKGAGLLEIMRKSWLEERNFDYDAVIKDSDFLEEEGVLYWSLIQIRLGTEEEFRAILKDAKKIVTGIDDDVIEETVEESVQHVMEDMLNEEVEEVIGDNATDIQTNTEQDIDKSASA